jgi:hypothetical protein
MQGAAGSRLGDRVPSWAPAFSGSLGEPFLFHGARETYRLPAKAAEAKSAAAMAAAVDVSGRAETRRPEPQPPRHRAACVSAHTLQQPRYYQERLTYGLLPALTGTPGGYSCQMAPIAQRLRTNP